MVLRKLGGKGSFTLMSGNLIKKSGKFLNIRSGKKFLNKKYSDCTNLRVFFLTIMFSLYSSDLLYIL